MGRMGTSSLFWRIHLEKPERVFCLFGVVGFLFGLGFFVVFWGCLFVCNIYLHTKPNHSNDITDTYYLRGLSCFFIGLLKPSYRPKVKQPWPPQCPDQLEVDETMNKTDSESRFLRKNLLLIAIAYLSCTQLWQGVVGDMASLLARNICRMLLTTLFDKILYFSFFFFFSKVTFLKQVQ